MIKSAGQRLLGVHDFRNLCKMDVNNGVVTFVRRIDSVDVAVAENHTQDDGPNSYDICCLIIKSKAFLWHQIRCIVAVLLMIGEGLEEETVIDELFDIETNPCRPAYQMASDLPLNLYMTEYPELDWTWDTSSMQLVMKTTQKLWAEHALKAAIIRGKLKELESVSGIVENSQAEILQARRKEKKYTKLMDLPRCPSLEDKVKTVVKKRKLELPKTSENCDNTDDDIDYEDC